VDVYDGNRFVLHNAFPLVITIRGCIPGHVLHFQAFTNDSTQRRHSQDLFHALHPLYDYAVAKAVQALHFEILGRDQS